MWKRNNKIPLTKLLSTLNKTNAWDLSGGPVIKNPPFKAGDVGLIPWEGTPHATEQLSLCAASTEPERLNQSPRVVAKTTLPWRSHR